MAKYAYADKKIGNPLCLISTNVPFNIVIVLWEMFAVLVRSVNPSVHSIISGNFLNQCSQFLLPILNDLGTVSLYLEFFRENILADLPGLLDKFSRNLTPQKDGSA